MLFIVNSLEYTDGKVLGSDEVIKLGSTDGKCIGNILGNLDGITLGIHVETELVSLDGFFDSYNNRKLEGVFFGGSLWYTDGKIPGSDEGFKLVYNDGKVIGSILVNLDVITLGLDDGT